MNEKLLERLVVAVERLAELPPIRTPVVTGIYGTREELREAVEKLHRAGVTGKAIAEKVRVSQATVSRLKHGDKKQDN
jgi:transcriptional regulator with XRE-family HTH domain